MNKSYTAAEKRHLFRIKEMPCSVCGQVAPSQAHHVKQDSAYHCIPLCLDCHNDIHGMKNIWRVYKMDEVDALAITMKNISNIM